MAENFFDQFDAAPTPAAPAGNFFDQFDNAQPARQAPQVEAYQPGVPWDEQPFSFRTHWEQQAEDELAKKNASTSFAGLHYGMKPNATPITADAVKARAEELARESGFAPNFGEFKERKAPDRRTIMNAGNPGMMLGSQSVWEPKTFAQVGDELIDLEPPKMPVGEAIAKGAIDMGLAVPGVKSLVSAAMKPLGTDKSAAELGQEFDAEATQALEDRPLSFRLGQGGAIAAGGAAKIYQGGVNLAPKLVHPAIVAKTAGDGAVSQAARFGGRVAAHSGVGALDFAGFNALAEAPNQARLEGRDATLGDRAKIFGETLTDPVSYAFGPATLAFSRAGNALVNTPRASIAASREAGAPRLKMGDVTPKDVQARVAAPHRTLKDAHGDFVDSLRAEGGANPAVLKAFESTPGLRNLVTNSARGADIPEGMSRDRFEAIKHLLKREMNPDDVENILTLYDYAGISNVQESLGILATSRVKDGRIVADKKKLQALNVALANIPGDAQDAWREFFRVFREGTADDIEAHLRRGMGISGEDYVSYVKGLEQQRRTAANPAYEAAAAKPIAPETWENQILPAYLDLRNGPGIIREAAGFVQSSGKPHGREVAAELHRLANDIEAISSQAAEAGFAGGVLPSGTLAELSQSLGSQVQAPRQVSTRSVIELDKFLGTKARGIESRAEQGGGITTAEELRNTQSRIRNTGGTSGLDPETGANVGRDISRKFILAQKAVAFGEKNFANGKPLRKLLEDFQLTENAEIDDLAKASILMGWVRAAEDAIEQAPNQAQMITKLYGTRNQRDKIMALLPKSPDGAGAGAKGANTKNVRALVGGKREDGRHMPSIFDRKASVFNQQKRMTQTSQTTPIATAILGESEVSKFIDGVFNIILNPRQTASNATRKVAHTVLPKPAIYKEGVNRELGNIMTTTGTKDIKSVLGEIRQVQGARGSRPSGGVNALATPATNGPVRGAGIHVNALNGDLAAGVAGGAAGSTQGNTPQERAANAVTGLASGIALKRGAGKLMGRAVLPRLENPAQLADQFGTVAEITAERAAKVAADLAKVRRALSPPEAAAAERLQEPFARSVKSFIGDDMKPEYELAFLQEIRRASNGGRITEAQADRAAQSAFDKVKGMPRDRVNGAGWTGERPIGFADELERGTDAFRDPRLNADQNKIAEMAKNGYSNAEIAEEMGTNAQSISVRLSQLRRKGVEIPKGTSLRPVTPERLRMEKLIEQGLSNVQIAKRLGKSPQHVAVVRANMRTKGPIRGAGFVGNGKPPKVKGDVPVGTRKRGQGSLGRGLRDLVNEPPPPPPAPKVTRPATGNALSPARVSEMTDAERRAFIQSGHEEGMIPLDPPSSVEPLSQTRKRLKRQGYDIQNTGKGFDHEGGLPVVAGILGGLGAVGGGAALVAYLTKDSGSDPRVPRELSRTRAQLAEEAATAYQRDPEGVEFRNAMIRLQQVDRQIEALTSDEPAGQAPPPPSFKPRAMNALAGQ